MAIFLWSYENIRNKLTATYHPLHIQLCHMIKNLWISALIFSHFSLQKLNGFGTNLRFVQFNGTSFNNSQHPLWLVFPIFYTVCSFASPEIDCCVTVVFLRENSTELLTCTISWLSASSWHCLNDPTNWFSVMEDA